MLSVSPNFLTADELAQLALAATDDGSVLKGVVVVNPDPPTRPSAAGDEGPFFQGRQSA